mmetsp:Transcript_6790/g.15514  ORF Transcript_6790/g.15514 Transcript_6790/m.15514 type:complete len:129 (-) Transcript_6790:542-928(-)
MLARQRRTTSSSAGTTVVIQVTHCLSPQTDGLNQTGSSEGKTLKYVRCLASRSVSCSSLREDQSEKFLHQHALTTMSEGKAARGKLLGGENTSATQQIRQRPAGMTSDRGGGLSITSRQLLPAQLVLE